MTVSSLCGPWGGGHHRTFWEDCAGEAQGVRPSSEAGVGASCNPGSGLSQDRALLLNRAQCLPSPSFVSQVMQVRK